MLLAIPKNEKWRAISEQAIPLMVFPLLWLMSLRPPKKSSASKAATAKRGKLARLLSVPITVLGYPHAKLKGWFWPVGAAEVATTAAASDEGAEGRFHIAVLANLLIVCSSLWLFAYTAASLDWIKLDGNPVASRVLRVVAILLAPYVASIVAVLLSCMQARITQRFRRAPETLIVIVVSFLATKLADFGIFVLHKDLAEPFKFFCECLEAGAVGYALLDHLIEIHFPTPKESTAPIKGYKSDTTCFINALRETNPSLEEEQRKGRALLWATVPIDLDERKLIDESTLKAPTTHLWSRKRKNIS